MADVESNITRMFNAPIGAPDEKLVSTGNGGLIIKDIVVLAEGTWTDSLVRTPLHYSAETLNSGAANWAATGIWTRHTGGAPRSISDKIGTISNPHYSKEHRAVLADGFLHGLTQASKDVIQLIKAGQVTDVSAEVGGKEVWNEPAKRYEAASLAFYGLAIVDKGACDVCKLKHNEAGVHTEDKEMAEGTTEPPAAPPSADGVEKSEVEMLKAKLAALEAELAALKAEQAAQEAAKAKVEEVSAALEKRLADSEAKVKELEKGPAPPKTVAGESSPDGGRELADPPMRIRWSGGECARV